MPSFNSHKTIRQCLESILCQKINISFDVIVVDNDSTDASLDIVKEYPVKIEIEKERGRSQARNKGWMSSESDYIAFIDADVVLKSDWAQTLIDGMSGYVGAIQGQIIPAVKKNCFLDEYRYWLKKKSGRGFFLNMFYHGDIVPLINTSACLFRRETLVEQGGFNTNFKRCEDTEMSMRLFQAGWVQKTVITTSAEVSYEESGLSYLSRSFFTGYWTGIFQSMHKEVSTPRLSLWQKEESIKINLFHQACGLLNLIGHRLACGKSLFKRPFLPNVIHHQINVDQRFVFSPVGILICMDTVLIFHHIEKHKITIKSEDDFKIIFEKEKSPKHTEVLAFFYQWQLLSLRSTKAYTNLHSTADK